MSTPHPPLWRPSHGGDSLRRRVGPLALRLYRRPGRSGYVLGIDVRLDATDIAEAAALAEAVAGAFLEAHGATRERAA